MQYLFNSWSSLKQRLLSVKYILLCLDFDGTITPIRPTPRQANLHHDQRQLLRKISHTKSFIVGIISGRALKDIKKKIGVKGLVFVGNHGLEIAYRKQNFIYPAAKRFISVIATVARQLTKKLTSIPQVVLEKKRLSLSLHYRLVKKEKMARLKELFSQIIKPYVAAHKIKLTSGKKVWELRPPINWNKGKAIQWLVQRLRLKSVFCIYVGDDETDEDAFQVVNRMHGISIVVGKKRNSCARYYLRSTTDVQRFLGEISKMRNEAVKSEYVK
jgi:trehalose-phosphatase